MCVIVQVSVCVFCVILPEGSGGPPAQNLTVARLISLRVRTNDVPRRKSRKSESQKKSWIFPRVKAYCSAAAEEESRGRKKRKYTVKEKETILSSNLASRKPQKQKQQTVTEKNEQQK